MSRKGVFMTDLKTVAILLSLSVSSLSSSSSDVQAGELRVGGIHPGFAHSSLSNFSNFSSFSSVSINRNGMESRNFGIRPGLVGPAHHWWRPGGAVTAGVAIGFVGAALASDWAGPPPASGYCWYYTDITHWHGFWDPCP